MHRSILNGIDKNSVGVDFEDFDESEDIEMDSRAVVKM